MWCPNREIFPIERDFGNDARFGCCCCCSALWGWGLSFVFCLLSFVFLSFCLVFWQGKAGSATTMATSSFFVSPGALRRVRSDVRRRRRWLQASCGWKECPGRIAPPRVRRKTAAKKTQSDFSFLDMSTCAPPPTPQPPITLAWLYSCRVFR